MQRIGIITNPHSKLNKRNPERIQLLGYILGEKGLLEITRSLEDLTRVAMQFQQMGIEVLAINGGDGTISRTLTAFIRVYGDKPLPKIALLRGGTMNVLAVNLAIHGSPEKLLARMLERLSDETPPAIKRLRTMAVEDHYGFVYADGTSTNILKEFYKNKSGVLGATWLGLRLVGSFLVNGKLYNQTLDERHIRFESHRFAPFEHRSFSVLAATIRSLPLGFPFFGLVHKNPGKLQFLSISTDRKKLVWQLPVIMLQNKERESLGKVSYCCDHVKMTTSTPFTYTLDGELYESQSASLDVRLGPEIEFIEF